MSAAAWKPIRRKDHDKIEQFVRNARQAFAAASARDEKPFDLFVLILGLIGLAACTHGLQLENGERPVQPVTRITFLFSEGQSDIVLNAPDAVPQPESGAGAAQAPSPATAPTGAAND